MHPPIIGMFQLHLLGIKLKTMKEGYTRADDKLNVEIEDRGNKDQAKDKAKVKGKTVMETGREVVRPG